MNQKLCHVTKKKLNQFFLSLTWKISFSHLLIDLGFFLQLASVAKHGKKDAPLNHFVHVLLDMSFYEVLKLRLGC